MSQGRNADYLLASLPSTERATIERDLRHVDLHQGDVLAEAGQQLEKIIFPRGAIIAKTAVMQDGGSVQTGIIGHEGFLGMGATLGQNIATSRFLVLHPGQASTLTVAAFLGHLERLPTLRPLLHKFIQAFVVQLLQMVACNSTHRIEQRCCRWLLMVHDRIDADRFPITQELLAEMLGVHRSSIGPIAAQLQDDGLITYRRGQVTIADRSDLEVAACDCYRIVREAYSRLVPAAHP